MCRMFAFMSRVSLQVQRSLVKAENALHVQSREHPHGWGIAYYLAGEVEPHRVRSVEAAFTDAKFQRVSEFLTSHAVVAHVRKATVGDVRVENTHPFQWGPFTFCHNGTIFGFEHIRDELLSFVHPRFRALVTGGTDSEVLFFLALTVLEASGYDLESPPKGIPPRFREDLAELLGWIRKLSRASGDDPREPMLNFVLTDGRVLAATRFNGGLSFSTQKVRCADYDICPIANKVCFGPRRHAIRHTHLLLASDPTSPDDVWEEVPNRGLLTLDSDFRLHVGPLPGLDGPDPWYP